MANNVLYVRNLRPNRVVLTHAGLRVVLERRGSREDTTSLPEDARNEPIIARWLRAGMIEEVTKEDFLDLAARSDAFDPNLRAENEPLTKSLRDPRTPGLPMSHDNSATPTVIDTDKIDKTKLSPQLEWVTPPDRTNIAPQEVPLQDLHRGQGTGRPDNLNSPDEVADQENLENVATPKKVAPRKKSTTAAKSKKK